jgi:hypothetical protein
MANWCEYFAERARSAFSDLTVYSNVDPTREWNGAATLEFNEPDEPTTRVLLSGVAQTDRTIFAIVRAVSTADVETFSARVRDFCVATCDALQKSGDVYAWSIDGAAVVADSRGIVEGESFYGYVEITITEFINHV